MFDAFNAWNRMMMVDWSMAQTSMHLFEMAGAAKGRGGTVGPDWIGHPLALDQRPSRIGPDGA